MGYINNDVAITQNGNAIVKSNGGKKVGTALGFVGGAAVLALPADKFVKVSADFQAFKNFIKGTNTSKMFGKLTEKLPKAGRVGVVATALLAAVAVPVAIYRGIGNLIDKSVNKHRAKKADVHALADKLNK